MAKNIYNTLYVGWHNCSLLLNKFKKAIEFKKWQQLVTNYFNKQLSKELLDKLPTEEIYLNVEEGEK